MFYGALLLAKYVAEDFVGRCVPTVILSLRGPLQSRTNEIVIKLGPGACDSTMFCDSATPGWVLVPKRMRDAGIDHYSLTRTQDALSSASTAVERAFQNLDAFLPAQVNVIVWGGSNRAADVLELKKSAQRLVCGHRYDDSVSWHLML
jgi:hypothetical protein